MQTIKQAESIREQATKLCDNITGYVSESHKTKGWCMGNYRRGEGMSKTAILDDIRKLRRDLLSISKQIEGGELEY